MARDRITGNEFDVDAAVIVKATGPWQWQQPELAGRRARRHFSIAWNMLIDRAPPSACALAVTDPSPGGQTYFLHPWKGRLLVGTGHAAWTAGPEGVQPTEEQLADMLLAINHGAPSLDLRLADIRRVYAGLLPAKRANSSELSVRSVSAEYPKTCAGSRFFSITGVKLTTARSVADNVLRQAFPGAQPKNDFYGKPRSVRKGPLIDLTFATQPDLDCRATVEQIRSIARDEAVVHLDDLLFRRTSVGDNPERARALAPQILALLEWQQSKTKNELARIDSACP